MTRKGNEPMQWDIYMVAREQSRELVRDAEKSAGRREPGPARRSAFRLPAVFRPAARPSSRAA